MGRNEQRSQNPWTVWAMRVTVAALLALVVYVMLAVPTNRYLNQRSEVSERSSQLEEISEGNADMEARLERLDDPTEIQRIARREYGLVTEGEESYTILPPSTAGLNLPAGWPFDALRDPVRRVSAAGG